MFFRVSQNALLRISNNIFLQIFCLKSKIWYKIFEVLLITPKNNIQKFEKFFWKEYFKSLFTFFSQKKFLEGILSNQ